MSFRRSLRRAHAKQEDPREVFSRELGHALERFGKAGGSLEQAAASLLRYAAQTQLMSKTAVTPGDFAKKAGEAYLAERSAIQPIKGHENY